MNNDQLRAIAGELAEEFVNKYLHEPVRSELVDAWKNRFIAKIAPLLPAEPAQPEAKPHSPGSPSAEAFQAASKIWHSFGISFNPEMTKLAGLIIDSEFANHTAPAAPAPVDEKTLAEVIAGLEQDIEQQWSKDGLLVASRHSIELVLLALRSAQREVAELRKALDLIACNDPETNRNKADSIAITALSAANQNKTT